MNYTTIIIIAVVGIVIGYWLSHLRKQSSCGASNKGIEKMNAVAREKKEDAKRKILALLESNREVRNDDVQNLLGVSDATATRYLDELEEENKIAAKGIARGTFYVLK